MVQRPGPLVQCAQFHLLVFVFIVLDVSKPNELNSLLVGYSNIVSQPMKKLTIKI